MENELNLTFDVFSSFFIVHLLGKVRYRFIWSLPAISVVVRRHGRNAESTALQRVVGAWQQNERRRGHVDAELTGSKNNEMSSSCYAELHDSMPENK